jgi:predicted transcriptional regulator
MEQETHEKTPESNQNQNQIQTEDRKLLSPKTSVLILTRLRAPSTRLLYSNNINADVKGKILKTLLKLKNNGLEEQTVKIVGFYLNHIAVNVNLEKPRIVDSVGIAFWGTP